MASPERQRTSRESSYSTKRPRKWLASLLQSLGRVTRFFFTVFCSAVLSLILQSEWRQYRISSRQNAPVQTRISASKVPGEDVLTNDSESKNPVPVGKMEDLYRKHQEEVFHTLRSNTSVRMVKLQLPSLILGYQRNLASTEDGTAMRLEGRAVEIPVIAVSAKARRFLDQMVVTYIDPKTLPPRIIDPNRLPFSASVLKEFLLVPDLSGNNAAFYTFERH